MRNENIALRKVIEGAFIGGVAGFLFGGGRVGRDTRPPERTTRGAEYQNDGGGEDRQQTRVHAAF